MTPKILLVDDKPANLYTLKAVLAELDADLIDTTSPVSALELVLEHTVALAIIDVQMPEMNGFELVSLMQGYFGSDMPPVIFVSAIYTDTSNFLQGYQAGAVDFMSKPFVPEILLGKVKVFLDLYRQKVQLGELVATLETQKDHLEHEVKQRTTAESALVDANVVLEKRASQLAANQQISAHVTSILDLDPLLETVVDDVLQAFDCHFAGIWLTESEERLTLKAYAGSVAPDAATVLPLVNSQPARHQNAHHQSSIIAVFTEGIPYMGAIDQDITNHRSSISDTNNTSTSINANDTNNANPTSSDSVSSDRASLENTNVATKTDVQTDISTSVSAGIQTDTKTEAKTDTATMLAVPLYVGSDRLGVLEIHSQTELDSEDESTLEGLAQQIAVAIRNAQRYELEQRLRVQEGQENQAFLRSLTENVPAAIYVRDLEGHYVFTNSYMHHLLALESSVLGKRDSDVWPTSVHETFTGRDDKVVIEEAISRQEVTIETIEPAEDGSQDEGRAANFAKRTLLDIRFPMYNAEQQLHALGGVTTDISELKRTSEALEIFKTLVEYASDGICIASDGGAISYASRAFYEMFGFNYQQRDLHDVPLASLFPMPEGRYVSRIIDGLRQGKTRRGESRQKRADESIFFSEYTAFPLSLISPEMQAADIDVPFQFTILLRDITERKQFEEELENLVAERTNQLDQARAEINVAQQIQHMLLPSPEELAAVEGLDIAAYMAPAAEVGGDYYDVLVHEGNVKIGIGDVTGHGLASGLVMLITQTAVRTLLSSHQADSKRFLEALNQTIYNNVERMRVDKSLTLLLLDYRQQHDRRDDATPNGDRPSNIGRVTLSGQHEEVLVVRSSGEVERIDTMDLGFPLGLEASIETFVAERSIVLEPGDGIVLYTDGITEAENPNGQQFGLDRLQTAVSQHWPGSARDVQNGVIAELNQFISNATVYDDITLLILKQR